MEWAEEEREKAREQAGEWAREEKEREQAREEKEKARERAREEEEREQAREEREKEKVKREEGEEKSERWQRRRRKRPWRVGGDGLLGRPNLPWRLDGKPPTAMWVRTDAEDLLPALFGRLLRGRHRAC